MIKNIILDVGMVLVDFCWQELLEKMGLHGADIDAVADATVRSPEWNEYDRSVWTDEQLLACFKKKAPDYETQIQEFWDRTVESIRQRPYAKEWIKELKADGRRVYILSNYSKRTYDLTCQNGLDFLPLADGALFSFEVGYVKPEPEIYHKLMDKYSLEPAECLFIDDNAINLEYPAKIGWQTVLFRSFAQVQDDMDKIISA